MKRLVPTLAIALAALACLPAGAQAAFGLNNFDVTFTAEDGSPSMQAGSHPFTMTTSLEANASSEETEGRLRELFLDFPPGLLANTTAGPRCLEATFLDPEEECPLSTVVGTSSSSFLEPSHSESTPVYSLAPPEGVILRLGFRVADAADVLVEVGISPDPPYNPIAVAGEWPEAVDVFATEVTLWGVPADPSHDPLRGACLDPLTGGSLGQCPVNVPQVPLLTLPTSCQEPQVTYYEADSWQNPGVFVSGNAVTHDNAEPPNPLGFTSCGLLAFDPVFSAQPTTEAAQSPSGFELALDVSDEGLTNPAGLAQSQIRDLVLTLPATLTTNPAAAEELESCPEADLEAETLETGPGDGCPEGSRLGTIEVETPLLEQSLEGSIFVAEPYESNLPNLYIVIKNSELGIIVKQIVEIEPDPETGQLVAFAEGLPQLPFSHLRLHLREVEGAPLITPPLCAAYDGHDDAHEPIWAELTPWSGEAPITAASNFEIVSGPNGGACPTGGDEHVAAPRAPGTIASDTTPPDTTISKRVLKRRPPIFVFHFQSTESGSTFLCRLDRYPFANCPSPKRFGHLKPGRHGLEVAAVDAAGNKDPTPAVARFMVPKTGKHGRRQSRGRHARTLSTTHATAAEDIRIQARMDDDGMGRLSVSDAGGPWSWDACAPDLTSCSPFGRGREIDTRGAGPGTVFRVESDGATGVSPEWRGRLKQLTPPRVYGVIRANEFVSPLPSRWSGGWEGEDSELQLSACTTATGQGCTTLTHWHYLRPCPPSSSFVLDARFAGQYLRVADRRIGPGPHPRFAYAVGSPYRGDVWKRSQSTAVALLEQIAPPIGPYPGECGPPLPPEASITKQGVAVVECRGGCRVVLVASRAGRQARVARRLFPQRALLAIPAEKLQVPPRELARIGAGRVRFVAMIDGKPAARRIVDLGKTDARPRPRIGKH